jgi:flagellar basal-body rod protein FlgF
MDRFAYTSLNGINERRLARHVFTNELANVSTPGFKKTYEAAMQANKTEGMGYDTRISPQMEKIERVLLTPGAIMVTGQSTDLAFKGQTLMGVRAPNGDLAFTRRGDLKVNINGVLENGQGHPVMGEDNNPISVPPGFALNITERGQVFARDPNVAGVAEEVLIGQILLRDASETVIVRREDGLFESFANNTRVTGDFPTGPVPVEVVSGALEGSNVNPVLALVKLIDESRSFEQNIKFIKEAKNIDEAGATMLRA